MSSDERPLPPSQDRNEDRKTNSGIALVRIVGILNLVVGLGLAAVCGCCSGWWAMALQAPPDQPRAGTEPDFAEREALARGAEDFEELQSIEAEQELERRQDTDGMSRTPPWLDDPWLKWGPAVDYGSASVLNLLLALAGVGLLKRANWCRWLTLIVAVAKLLRLPMMCWFYVFVVSTPISVLYAGFVALLGVIYPVFIWWAMLQRDTKRVFGLEQQATA